MDKKATYQGELSNYTPTLRERIVDFLAQSWYGDTREGVDRAKRLISVGEMLPPVAAATYGYDTGRAIAEERYGDAAIAALASGAGVAALPVAAKGASVAEGFAPRAITPASKNHVVVSPGAFKSGPLADRMPKTDADITYGYRSMSYGELRDAIDNGFLRPNPKGSRHGKRSGEKWLSGGDEAGQFGRTWKGGDDASVRVRVARDKIPENDAIRTEDLEILDHQTKQFVPLTDVLTLQRKANKP